MFAINIIFGQLYPYFWYKLIFAPNTVKPVLTATPEQRPPVNNDRPKSPGLLNLV